MKQKFFSNYLLNLRKIGEKTRPHLDSSAILLSNLSVLEQVVILIYSETTEKHIKMSCHCEERSDEAIQNIAFLFGLPRSRWSLAMTVQLLKKKRDSKK